MTNTKLIEDAVKLVVDLLEAEGIMESTASIRSRATEWYNNTEIVDAKMLAAATIAGSYQIETCWEDFLYWRELYFPSYSIEEIISKIDNCHIDEVDWLDFDNEEVFRNDSFHIGEIEEAQKDELWR